ncbi:hypothetical protein GGS23DRAFT_281357 [Durotheca rogersii]|uniref:uncharacterized protein n=1 Tax=Durotheca rogersii TaxID=419775 RepID=UPI00221EADAA|nr:uncharacterized protein GGS23DRAFT_281357 [Durotheca rogersii]KAI5866655.1 hypothetical protein GGS23DRAFT_281357 [Durotheca rogersii]
MAIFNPLQFLIFPFVFLVALPLALCAGVTTMMAFMVLFLRLFLVYLDVGLETLRYVVLGNAAQARSMRTSSSQRTPLVIAPASPEPFSPPSSPSTRRHKRRTSGSLSSGSTTSMGGLNGFSLTPGIELERDFEGVGGWRLDNVEVEADAAADQQWYNLNSRLRILDRRHHFRSRSGGVLLSRKPGLSPHTAEALFTTAIPSPEEGRRTYTSANSSRSRTPTKTRPYSFSKLDQDEYFPLQDDMQSNNMPVLEDEEIMDKMEPEWNPELSKGK